MAGVVVEIRVQEGHEVKAGDPICIMSAMKMEQNVTAPVGGKVSRVAVGPGDSLGSGDLIVEVRTIVFAWNTLEWMEKLKHTIDIDQTQLRWFPWGGCTTRKVWNEANDTELGMYLQWVVVVGKWIKEA